MEATLRRKGSTMTADAGPGLARAIAFQGALAEAHLAGITWPTEYGGRGLSGRYQRIFDTEAKAFDVPPRSLDIGLGMCGPTLLVHGTEDQKRTLIPALLRGEHVWCELFSEPGAGSDLSSVQTRARRDGDEYVVDGQKVWTSGAQHSDYAVCLTRTDIDRPKREGITMFIVDMHAPGIAVRPLRQLTGESHFNEVFLDDVHVPVADVLGELNDGWRVARTVLAFERQALSGMGSSGGGKGGFNALIGEARRRNVASNPVMRDRLVQLRIHQIVLRHLTGYLQARSRDGAHRVHAQTGHGSAGAGDGSGDGRPRRHGCHGLGPGRHPRRPLVVPVAQLPLGVARRGDQRNRPQRHRRTGLGPAPRSGRRSHAGRSRPFELGAHR